jgi:hypothetical protein
MSLEVVQLRILFLMLNSFSMAAAYLIRSKFSTCPVSFTSRNRAAPAPSRHVALDLIKLDLSRSAGLEQAEERDVGAYGDPGLIRVL